MRLVAIGGDARSGCLVRLALQRGIAAHGAGIEGVPGAGEEEVRRADAVVLPDLGILEHPPYAVMAEWLKKDVEIYIYAAAGVKSECCGCGRRLVNLLEDEEYVGENARLTAEGALVKGAWASDRALMGSRAVILGYGRIAKALCRRLLDMGAEVRIAARREEARAEARKAGAADYTMDEMGGALQGADFIFNTVPARILAERELGYVAGHAVLMELAGNGGGFDPETAGRMGLKVCRENGLPGRYCPVSGAKAMLEAILRIGKGEKGV